MLTWSPEGTPHGRLFFRLRPSERPISESAAFLWATPDTRNAQDGAHLRREAQEALARGSHHAMSLHHMAAMWPTPRMEGFDAGSHHGAPDSLHAAVKTWPTPQERDWRQGSPPDSARMARKAEQGWSPNLPDMVPTGKLNPTWVESLMGFPPGWTALAGQPVPAKRNTTGKRRARSQASSPTARPD